MSKRGCGTHGEPWRGSRAVVSREENWSSPGGAGAGRAEQGSHDTVAPLPVEET